MFAALAGGAPARTAAAGLPPALQPRTEVQALSAEDGDTLLLADGRALRLAAVMAPKPPLQDPPPRSWPIAERARQALEEIGGGRTLKIAFDRQESDRYGRLVGHAATADGTWLQAVLVGRGLARVATTAQTRAGAAELLALEREARAAGRGLWALSTYRVLPPDAAGRNIDSFQILEGTVRDVATKGRTVELHLGAERRRGLVVRIAPSALRLFRGAGLDPSRWRGETLRIRGWVRSFDGPLVDASHPEQIEVLTR